MQSHPIFIDNPYIISIQIEIKVTINELGKFFSLRLRIFAHLKNIFIFAIKENLFYI